MTRCTAYRCRRMDGELLEHVAHLRAFAVSLCGDPDAANDLVQDTLLKALTNIDSFQPGTNMRAWLFTILRNTYFTQHRRKRFEIRDEEGAIAAAQCVKAAQDDHLELRDFERALRTLSDEQREALVLVGAAGFTYEEAARIGGCSSGTVKSRVCRARARLQELLYGGSPPEKAHEPTPELPPQCDVIGSVSPDVDGEDYLSDAVLSAGPWNNRSMMPVA